VIAAILQKLVEQETICAVHFYRVVSIAFIAACLNDATSAGNSAASSARGVSYGTC